MVRRYFSFKIFSFITFHDINYRKDQEQIACCKKVVASDANNQYLCYVNQESLTHLSLHCVPVLLFATSVNPILDSPNAYVHYSNYEGECLAIKIEVSVPYYCQFDVHKRKDHIL